MSKVSKSLHQLARWLRAVRDKYFTNPEDLRGGLANLLLVVDRSEKFSGVNPYTTTAREFIGKLQKGVDMWDTLDG